MFFFITGVVLIIGGLAFGLPLMWRGDLGTGGALGIMIPAGVLGLAGAITGLIMGKSAPAAEPPPMQPIPLQPEMPQQPQRVVLRQADPTPPPPPPPMPMAPPPPVEAGPATRGRGATVGPNGYLQVLEGPAAGRQLAIKPNIQISIGRADDNFFVIPDPEVSSRHCVLTCANDRIDFQDLGSSNGSFIDGQPLRQGRIQSGQTLQLGRYTKIYFSFK
jgi:hypothetical protein